MRMTFIVSAILGLLAGIVWGHHAAVEASQAMEMGTALSASQVTSTFSAQQFRHADNNHAKNAVLEEIHILTLLVRAADDRVYYSRLGLAYTRLAMVEESLTDPDAVRRALDEAKGWFKKDDPGREFTEDEMKQVVQKMDDILDRTPP